MKPVYKSKKVWTAALSLIGSIAVHFTGNPEVSTHVVALGMALVVAIGLADFGKEATQLSEGHVDK